MELETEVDERAGDSGIKAGLLTGEEIDVTGEGVAAGNDAEDPNPPSPVKSANGGGLLVAADVEAGAEVLPKISPNKSTAVDDFEGTAAAGTEEEPNEIPPSRSARG